VEDGEGKSNISDDTDNTRADTLVEAHDSISSQDLLGTVHSTAVLVGVHALHFGFDNINGVVSHGGAETGKSSRDKIAQPLDGDVLGQLVVGVFEHNEADSLVG